MRERRRLGLRREVLILLPVALLLLVVLSTFTLFSYRERPGGCWPGNAGRRPPCWPGA